MSWDVQAKKLTDKLLRSVGLEPQLGTPDYIDINFENHADDIKDLGNGVKVITFTKPVMGVPSGTLLPATCQFTYPYGPEGLRPPPRSLGTVERLAHSREWRTKEQHFWVSYPGPRRRVELLVPSSQIELTRTEIDWGDTPRTRTP